MANGLLDPNNPFQSPIETQDVQPTADGLLGGSPQPPGDMDRMRQIYGLLAQYADDPTQVGLAAARAMQQQRQFEQQQSPAARMERSIGPLTPGHYTEQSLQNYWNNLQQTGDRDYSLLERHEALTDRETGLIDTAMKEGYQAETMMNRASRLARGFAEAAKAGQAAGIIADLRRFGARILGTQDASDKLFMELDALANEEIIQNLPPGVASDRDIEIAMRGRPPATANPAYVAAWLNGKVKQNAIKREYAAFRSNYLSRNRTLAGFPEAWDAAREAVTMRALERAGGLYAPVDAGGNLLTPAQAAMRKYGEMLTPSLPQIVPGQAPMAPPMPGATPVAPTEPAGDRRQTLMQKYNLR